MRIKKPATAAIAAAAMAAVVGVSTPAHASVSTHQTAAAPAGTITPDMWLRAYVYSNTAWGWTACTAYGVALKLAGQVSAWYCAVDADNSSIIWLWVNR